MKVIKNLEQKIQTKDIVHGTIGNYQMLDEIIEEKKDIGWKSISWSGNDTGGTITTNLDLRGRLVSLRFKSSTNDYHHCYVTLFWSMPNNYLIAQMYNQAQYILCNNTNATGFNLTIPSTIKLDAIHYLNL